MADCSKTVDFFKERQRMCDSYKCKMCPAQVLFNIPDVCPVFDDNLCDEKIIDFVQKWSDSHPEPKPKTYADVFRERFPKNTFQGWALWQHAICRKQLFGGADTERCEVDCKECWNEPYEEGGEVDEN